MSLKGEELSSSFSDGAASAATNQKNQKLFLLWEREFGRSFVYHIAALTSLGTIGCIIPSFREVGQDMYLVIHDRMLQTAHRYAWWSILGLLASSCCALQLLLNSLSLGCAGFNTMLGPWRPQVLAVTLCLQCLSWNVAWSRPWQWKPTLLSTLIATSLALLPEMLYVYTVLMKKGQNITKNKTETGETTQSTVLPKDARMSTSQDDNNVVVYTLSMEKSVGCSACLLTVSNRMDALSYVLEHHANMEQGNLRVVCQKGTPSQKLLDALEDAGFPMTISAGPGFKD